MTGSSILRIHSRPPGEPSRTSADPIPSCPSSRAPPARRVGRGGQRSDVALVDEAVGVARRVPALKAGLVYPAPAEVVAVREEARIDSHTADVGVRVDARHPRADALRIEDVVPGGIERVGRIDASAVPADLHHLRPAPQPQVLRRWVRRAADDPAEVHRTRLLWVVRVADVVLL